MSGELIRETILTSVDSDDQPHLAPFGVRERNGLVLISPFRSSASLDNLLAGRCAVLNFTDDVRIFAGLLTNHREWPVKKAEKINGCVLEAALAHQELELVKVEDDAVRPNLYFRIVHAVNHAPFRGFNRAQAAVIELAVLVSRLDRLPSEKIASEMAYLRIAMEKTAGEHEWQAWNWLVERIGNFQAARLGENLA